MSRIDGATWGIGLQSVRGGENVEYPVIRLQPVSCQFDALFDNRLDHAAGNILMKSLAELTG
jgi:hypothetical protein